VFCDHPDLEEMTRRTDGLRERVDEMLVQQLEVDAGNEWRGAKTEEEKSHLLDAARRSYAFYLCGACEEPYFGGTVECADEEEGERLQPEDRLCGICSPKSTLVCNRAEHGAFHVWKCRYCCSPSSFVCYGNVHFCDRCHDRNSDRYRMRRGGRQFLETIPCPGESCNYPKPEGCDKHKDGEEQVYYCAACMTDTMRTGEQQSPGSRNLIVNPSGEDGTRGWNLRPVQFTNVTWRVERMEVPVDDLTSTNFVSSFHWCVMTQTVPLHRFLNNPSQVRIEASAKFMGRTDCPSVFKLEVLATDARNRVLHRTSTPVLTSPVDFWERAVLVLEPLDGLHEVILVVCGKDSRFWQGDYGSKVCQCSIRAGVMLRG
jgi:hypothetical protein